ncbi:hypothetical protein BVRB_008320 [Beta vulgaris subsp. vulgaris]|uniref:Uncharacterized protein n=1 Tax=Beta vulgaris subsp. vulgaris TaxID=3555 RepID=A0A0J8B6M0_BETVV|nr:hypothetical protein BVRB_008320 [Beta vulgaris subsp. vulgaris]
MEGMWLLCDYKGKQFDVRVEDVDLTSIIDLFNEIHDESVKQGVWLPENFRVHYKHPRTKKLVELYDDPHLSNMWGGFVGLDTVEVFIEDTQQPPRFVMKLVKDLREEKRKAEAEKLRKIAEEKEREREEERKRQEEEDELRELEEQMPPVAIEIPVYNPDDMSVMEYLRIFSQEEVVMGESQPEAESQAHSPAPPPPQTQPQTQSPVHPFQASPPPSPPPETQPQTQSPPQASPPPSPPPETQPQTQSPPQASPPPSHPTERQTHSDPQSSKPAASKKVGAAKKKGAKKGFKAAKTTAKRKIGKKEEGR